MQIRHIIPDVAGFDLKIYTDKGKFIGSQHYWEKLDKFGWGDKCSTRICNRLYKVWRKWENDKLERENCR